MGYEPKMVVIEYIEEALKSRHTIQVGGKIIHGEKISEEKAILGEKKGKWRILRDIPPEVYETHVMRSEAPLTKEEVKGIDNKLNITKRVKKKRVAWLQDSVRLGGAEISNREVVRVGMDCGFQIEILNQGSMPNEIEAVMMKSDIVILNNLWAFDSDRMKMILKGIYSDGLPYVKYEHDHREIGRPGVSKPLFQRSRLNVFISPVHRENHVKALGCEGICLPLAIDTEFFKSNGGVRRESGTALVCNVRNFKSWKNLQAYIDEHPEIKFMVLASDPVVRGSNVLNKPMIPYEQMPAFYSSFEYLVHILDGWGGGERVIFEAALCGCKVVANEKVGHMSWGKDLTKIDELREWLTQAPYDFWKEIDKVL